MRTISTTTASSRTAALAPVLRDAVARLARRMRQEAALGEDMTPTRFTALTTIGRDGPMTVGQLAAAEQVAGPTMTRVVAALEGLGYITRAVSPHDRRSATVELTPAGEAFLQERRARRDAFLAERLSAMTTEERSTLVAAVPLLERLFQDRP